MVRLFRDRDEFFAPAGRFRGQAEEAEVRRSDGDRGGGVEVTVVGGPPERRPQVGELSVEPAVGIAFVRADPHRPTGARLGGEERGVQAVREHVEFFLALDPSQHGAAIPTCPEWTVEDVLRHVSGGALTVCEWVERAGDPTLDAVAVLHESHGLAGAAPLAELTPSLMRYVELIESRDEHAETFLFDERVSLGKQVWHATGDWGIHRHDVELALGSPPSLTAERAGDLIGWLLEYLQPTVEANRSWDRPPGLRLVADDAPVDVVAGEGQPQAVLRASARDLLMFLWRRPTGPVVVEGDPKIVHAYLDRVV